MTDKGGLPTAELGWKPEDLGSLLAKAITDHGHATAGIFKKYGDGKEVSLLEETVQCTSRFLETASKFVLFWDNFATAVALNIDTPRYYGPPPVGTSKDPPATVEAPANGAMSGTVVQLIRRRGDKNPAWQPPSPIQITHSTADDSFVVTLACTGLDRGVYEGTINVVDNFGAPDTILYNIYINPT